MSLPLLKFTISVIGIEENNEPPTKALIHPFRIRIMPNDTKPVYITIASEAASVMAEDRTNITVSSDSPARGQFENQISGLWHPMRIASSPFYQVWKISCCG